MNTPVVLRFFLLPVLCQMAVACVSSSEADRARQQDVIYPEPIPDSAWPPRRTAGLDQIASGWSQYLHQEAPSADDDPGDRGTGAVMASRRGVVIRSRPTDRSGRPVGAEGETSYTFLSYAADDQETALPTSDGVREGMRVSDGETFTLIVPSAAEVRGTVAWIDGQGSLEEEARAVLRNALLGRGWAVLETSMDSLVRDPLVINVVRDEDLDQAAARLAQAIDDRLAELAYGLGSTLEVVERERPELKPLPLILLGIGTGGSAAPTVAALLGERVTGAVMIAAGANLFEISASHDLPDTGIHWVLPTEKFTAQQFDWVSELYLAESRLDPYHTSRFLAGRPVLLFQARFDDVIPAWASDLLYLRLRRPDRIRALGGHSVLNYALKEEVGTVCDWIDTTAGYELTAP